jgi:hypothetical protein
MKPAIVAAALSLTVLASVGLAEGPPRQFYGKWQKTGDVYVCKYYFKPTVTINCNFTVHYVYWWPDDPARNKWMFMYNPESDKYWGRCPCPWHDEYEPETEQWCKLNPNNTWTDIIPDFCPPIPGSGDDGPLVDNVPPPPPTTKPPA